MSSRPKTFGSNLLAGVKSRASTARWVGIALIVAGLISMATPLMTGLSVMLVIGVLMIAGGIATAVLAFGVGAFGRGIWLLLLALLTIVAGYTICSRPLEALASVTLFLAAYFFLSGIVEMVAAFGEDPAPGRGWMFTSGLVSVLLGTSLWRHFPASTAVAVGVLFGVRLLFNGAWLLSVGMAAGNVTSRLESGARR